MTTEKKNILKLITLTVFVGLSVWIVLREKPRGNEIDRSVFKVLNTTCVDAVILESVHGKVELHFDGIAWGVDHAYLADKNMMDVLFATVQQVEVVRPLPASMQNAVGETIKKQGVHVSFFCQGEEVKNFWVGSNSSKTQTYFQLEGGAPQVVTIPGYRVYVAGIFELAQGGWRDKFVFGFNWRNFKGLEVHYPGNEDSGFKVSASLQGLFEVEELDGTDTTKLNDYLDRISLLQANRFGTEQDKNALLLKTPSYRISVMDIADKVYSLWLYDQNEGEVAGLLNESECLFFNPNQIANIVKKRVYFKKNN